MGERWGTHFYAPISAGITYGRQLHIAKIEAMVPQ